MIVRAEKVLPENDAAGVLPPVIFGTSGLGNLFEAYGDELKYAVVRECLRVSNGRTFFDSAGKYGAGLALEVLGKCLRQLQVPPEQVVISNKLGWYRTPLKTTAPTFEPGVWKGLEYDAVQKISYKGILECFEQGNELLGGYIPQMVSVHDPDEYLATAKSKLHEQQLYEDVLGAYKALHDLKQRGKVQAIGVGAKDWKTIRRIAADVPLDWVMIANSMTIRQHPQALLDLMVQLSGKGVKIINAALFHSGFLLGGDHYDYKPVIPGTAEHDALYSWRTDFQAVCSSFGITPAAACIQFGLHAPGVTSIALNTMDVKRIEENMQYATTEIAAPVWRMLQAKGLMQVNFFEQDASIVRD
ncbi:aldo/keto reductase [Paraflavitalea soli]|uniref:Aldo/keto reductase n=1 Tax=Paraflavitalea soli TaxID=2315862 RepID=A0A3B7MMC5_9BACT|nr:aldo/keto reductase [Paraflavitalea soli]AXY74096.1 aldo/keto reductase [Paraflavitalea soli]